MINLNPIRSALCGALAALGLAAVASPATAQSFNYRPQNAQVLGTTYQSLDTVGTVIATANFDDADSAPQNIGFSFPYNGSTFSSFILSSNGFIKLGSSPLSDPYLYLEYAQTETVGGQLVYPGGPIASSDSRSNNIIAPLAVDLAGALSGGTEYRVATTGVAPNRVCTIQWKNVRDKPKQASSSNTATIGTQYASISFQVKLYETSGQVDFVYGPNTAGPGPDAFRSVAVGLKGNYNAQGLAGDVVMVDKASATAWSSAVFYDNYYVGTDPFNIRSSVRPVAGTTYRFRANAANDADVMAVYTLGQVPVGRALAVQAVVRNAGTQTLTNLPVTLTVSGVNTFSNTQLVGSLAPGASATVTFASYTTSTQRGNNTVLVTVPADAYPVKNALSATQLVTASTLNYVQPIAGSGITPSYYGFDTREGITAVKFNAPSATTVLSVTDFIPSASNSVGQIIYGVLLDAAGTQLARTPNYTVRAADIGTNVTFSFAAPVAIPAGDFLVGIAQPASAVAHYPIGLLFETPVRPGAFYDRGSLTTGSFSDRSLVSFGPFLIGAVLRPSPVISSFTPASGPVGTSVRISGANFAGTTAVTFNGTTAPGFAVDTAGTSLTVLVPAGASTGPIAVATAGGTAVSPTSFTVTTPPTITSFTPTTGPAGTNVTVTGTNLNNISGVTVNGTPVTSPIGGSSTSVSFAVPSGATTGPISITTASGTVTSTSNFTVTASPASSSPVLSNSSFPENAPIGRFIGKFTTPAAGAVAPFSYGPVFGTGDVDNNAFYFSNDSLFTGSRFDFETRSSYSIRVRSTDANGQQYERAIALTVTDVNDVPTIASFTPTSGPTGTRVTVTGSNFFDVTGVFVNNVAVTGIIDIDQIGGTTVQFPVPSGATTGPISITTTAGTATSTSNFTVTASTRVTISSISPTSGPVGTVVTITGTNLNNTTNALFIPGTSATFTVVSPTELRVTVPASLTPGNKQLTIIGGGGSANAPGGFTVTAGSNDLTVSSAQSISGAYTNVTITGTGVATLTGQLKVSGTLTVQTGGALLTNCQPVRGTGSLTLQAGATLGICDAAGIRASSADTTGAIRLTGTRSFSTDASYRYNGSQAQVTGSGLPAQVRNLELSNASGLRLSQPVAVAQVLLLNNGDLNTNGQMLTLLSSATGTALVDNTGGVVNGTTTVQRYISPALNAGLGYRHLATPVTFDPVSDLATSGFTPVVNPAYNSSATPNLVTPFPTVFGYDQSRLATTTSNQSAFDKGWFSPAALTSQLNAGQGYTVNMAAGQTVDFVGGLINGNYFYNFVRGTDAAAGWQLLGNPYPAPLDWSRVAAADRAGLNAAIYVFESTGPYAGRYRSYANGIGVNPIVPLGQGFFVRVADGQTSAALTLRNSHRLTSPDATPLLRGTADVRPQVQLALQGAGLADAAYVYFEAGATTGADAEYDARKLPNTNGLNLAALAGTDALAVNGLPALTTTTVVPLQVAVPAAGSYTLRAEQLLNFVVGTQVLLHDDFTGQDIDLQRQASYSFTHNGAATGRFSLVFRPSGVTATASARLADQLTVFPNPTAGSFTVRLSGVASGQPAHAVLYNALGQAVLHRTLPSSSTGLQAEFDVTRLPAGVYTLRLVLTDGTQLTKRVVKQ
ncbi:IPT/TIG domain-containing protein [Hymenobacter jeollabukensis]|uniref:T9SS type A sorting domain-containing protein n=1 Tax=Hymenobacter jeollabukensis TaxID=2025313 RepID=A0A5R8WKN2_9BACT|nr:IPT/TIG domain-containing protein [Hymenobacter jeollabukensis]TLM89234.1 T9SS type A sorting domain-containing protein [Hymenobacter jeollabukensis]